MALGAQIRLCLLYILYYLIFFVRKCGRLLSASLLSTDFHFYITIFVFV